MSLFGHNQDLKRISTFNVKKYLRNYIRIINTKFDIRQLRGGLRIITYENSSI